MQKLKAAFFDRDGTIIHDVSYLSNLEDVRILPKALDIMKMLQQKGYFIFVVTNQSGIARGFFDEVFVNTTHTYLERSFARHGIVITKFYFCPHHPTQAVIGRYKQDCLCRKPKPGMLLSAALEYNIDLSKSLMFGDKDSDLQAGLLAGCKSFDVKMLFDMAPEGYAKLW